jgi:capsular exopolysaccharide synthesis family protein
MSMIPNGSDPVKTNGTSGRPGGDDRRAGGDAQYYIDLLRRRWWAIAGALVLALTGFFVLQSRSVDLYSADVLLKKEAERSPLEALAGPMMGRGASPEAIATQLETLRTRAIIGPVVDSLGLRLVLDGRTQRLDLLEAVSVDQDAPTAEYTLAQNEGHFVLRSGSREIGRAAPGQWLQGPGFRMLLAPDQRLAGEIDVVVTHRQRAIGRLQRDLRIEPVRATSLIRVRYTNPDRLLAAEVVNGVARSYQLYAATRGRDEAALRREFIATQLASLADSVRSAHAVLAQYQQQSRTLDPRVEGDALSGAIMTSETELQQLRFQESVLQNLMTAVAMPGDAGLSRLLAVNPDLLPGGAALYDRLQALETERRRMTLNPAGVRQGGPATAAIDSQIATIRNDIRSVAQEGAALVRDRRIATEVRMNELRARAGGLPERATAFTRLQQRVEAVQVTFDLLSEKYYEAQIAEAVEIGDVEVIDAAEPPLWPDASNAFRNFVLAMALGTLLGLVAAVGIDRLDTRIREPMEAQRATGLDIIALIPDLRSEHPGEESLLMRPGEHGAGAESFRKLRTMLHFMRVKRPQVLAVTSSGPGEGKSTVAANLALVLAQEGGEVLLIDTDLRRPTQHTLFGTDRGPGLSEALVGDITMEGAVRRYHDQIDVLTCGSYAPNPAELLGSPAFAQLLQSARKKYKSIVVDTPPILAVTDAGVIAHLVDGVIIIVRSRRTDRFALSWGIDQLRKMRAPLLGVVLNGVESGESYYGRYGGDYGREYHAAAGNGASSNGGRHRGAGSRLRAVQRMLTGGGN